MLRGPLGNNNYKPKFSGHDTFPFRFTWLPKLVNYIEDGKSKIIKESEKNVTRHTRKDNRELKTMEREQERQDKKQLRDLDKLSKLSLSSK